jgi:hypothetical protein
MESHDRAQTPQEVDVKAMGNTFSEREPDMIRRWS